MRVRAIDGTGRGTRIFSARRGCGGSYGRRLITTLILGIGASAREVFFLPKVPGACPEVRPAPVRLVESVPPGLPRIVRWPR